MDNLGLGKIITTEQERDAVHVAVVPVVAAEPMLPGQHIGLGRDGRAEHSAKSIGIVDPFLTQRVDPGERFWLFLYPGSVTSLRHHYTHPDLDGPAETDHSEDEEDEEDEPRGAPVRSPPDGPKWRTPTVLSICQRVRENPADRATLAVLADALEDGGYPGIHVLEAMRQSWGRKTETLRLVALVYSHQSADAVEWLEMFAASLGDGMDYDDLMEAAEQRQRTGDVTVQDMGESWRDGFWGNEETFWKHYEAVTGSVVKERDANVFCCHC